MVIWPVSASLVSGCYREHRIKRAALITWLKPTTGSAIPLMVYTDWSLHRWSWWYCPFNTWSDKHHIRFYQVLNGTIKMHFYLWVIWYQIDQIIKPTSIVNHNGMPLLGTQSSILFYKRSAFINYWFHNADITKYLNVDEEPFLKKIENKVFNGNLIVTLPLEGLNSGQNITFTI